MKHLSFIYLSASLIIVFVLSACGSPKTPPVPTLNPTSVAAVTRVLPTEPPSATQTSIEFEKPTSTATTPPTPEPETSPLTLLSFGYILDKVENGYNFVVVPLAAENPTDEWISGRKFSFKGAFVETKEGRTYPIETGSDDNQVSFIPLTGARDADEADRQEVAKSIPPHFRFRWNRGGKDQDLRFKFPPAAHPTRIIAPEISGFSIELEPYNETPSFPADKAVLSQIKPLESLVGTVLIDDPTGIKAVITGFRCRAGNITLIEMLYSIENRDQFDSKTAEIETPRFLASYGSDGEYVTPYPNLNYQRFTANIEAGPAVKRDDVLTIEQGTDERAWTNTIFDFYTNPAYVPETYFLVNFDNQTTVYKAGTSC